MDAVPKKVFSVQVRELVEFVWRSGDLGAARDFVGADRALAGTRGHQRLQRSRPTGYQKEVRLSLDLDAGPFVLRIQGRLDGVLAGPQDVLLEEIKTVRGSWDRAENPLHWAQAKVYGFIYARDHLLESLAIQLAYLDLDSDESAEIRRQFAVSELSAFFESTTGVYVDWLRERHKWVEIRDRSIKVLEFPFGRYRAGQRELAVATYRTIERGGRLFLEAPTGIGKTISVLFPAVKALANGHVEQIFYLTARTLGREAAQKAISDLRAGGLRLSALTLTARDKLCVRNGVPCDVLTCPLARGYYDRRKPAMREALRREQITRAVLEDVAREHQVCPFELSLDLSIWVDAVICDYNYVFDPAVYLRRRFGDPPGAFAFLIDEAHNLVERAREMFSADINFRDIDNVRCNIRSSVPRCAKALGRLNSALHKLSELDAEIAVAAIEPNLFPAATAAPSRQPAVAAVTREVQTSREFPAHLLPLLDEALKNAESWLVENNQTEFRQGLLDLYFQLHAFRRTAGLFDERYATILEPGTAGRLRLFCVDPSFLLRKAMARGESAIFFSATLSPLDYYRVLLGGGPDDPVVQLPSPFPPEHLAVLVHERLRTHLKAREATLGDVAQAVAALVRNRPGNYIVYLPSYQYLVALQEEFEELCLAARLLGQRPGMSESEREAFLAAFMAEPSADSTTPDALRAQSLVGFAVLGGVFGEGIDLTGNRLIGVIVVGVGLPQLCPERDLIRDYFQQLNGCGFAFAYTFPGMNRVLQATGRVIRSESDRGVVMLIDARFGESGYRRLFPSWWRTRVVRNLNEIHRTAGNFWQTAGMTT